MVYYKDWCFTIHDPNWVFEFDENYVEYCVYQHESCPTTGRVHVQGYLELVRRKARSTVKREILKKESAHVEHREGTREQARDYCMKVESRVTGTEPIEYGAWRGDDLVGAGTSRLTQLLSRLKRGDDAFELFYGSFAEVYVRHKRSIDEWLETWLTMKERNEMSNQFIDHELYDWQLECTEKLQSQSDRQVLWIFDEVGNVGKTYLAKRFLVLHEATYLRGGKLADMCWLIANRQTGRYLILDLPRSSSELLDPIYRLIEMCKDGMIWSGKYSPKMRLSVSMKVCVFSNFYPEGIHRRISEDRICLYKLREYQLEEVLF